MWGPAETGPHGLLLRSVRGRPREVVHAGDQDRDDAVAVGAEPEHAVQLVGEPVLDAALDPGGHLLDLHADLLELDGLDGDLRLVRGDLRPEVGDLGVDPHRLHDLRRVQHDPERDGAKDLRLQARDPRLDVEDLGGDLVALEGELLDAVAAMTAGHSNCLPPNRVRYMRSDSSGLLASNIVKTISPEKLLFRWN